SIIAGDEEDEPVTKDTAQIGQIVLYEHQDEVHKGVISEANPVNAIVKLLSGEGRLIKYAFLRMVSEEDDDYDELEDLSERIKAKLQYYRNLRVGQSVQIKSIFKGQKTPQTYTGQVTELLPRSDKVGVRIPIGKYNFRYTELVVPSGQSTTQPSTQPSVAPWEPTVPPTAQPLGSPIQSRRPSERPGPSEEGSVPTSVLPISARALSRAEVTVGTPVSFEARGTIWRGIVVKNNPVNAVIYTVNDEPWNIRYGDLMSTTPNEAIQQLADRLRRKRALMSRLKVGDVISVYTRQRGATSVTKATVTELPKNEKITVDLNGRNYRLEYLDLVV
ncbi:unnamed protein product, partial [marine sediment metagenome]